MCSPSRLEAGDVSHEFTEVDRESWFLGGRPADVCAWAGLETPEGWRQMLNRAWFVLTGRDVYGPG